MDLRHLTDETLLADTENAARDERECLTKVLHHLREVDRRRLYSTLHFSSLYDYAIKKLGYSEDQAHRRISAMRLLRTLPEIESKITSGSLNLTSLGLAQTFFKREAKSSQAFSKAEKVSLLEKLENKSKREAQKEIFAASSDPIHLVPDKIRIISQNKIEIKFTASEDLQDKIKKLKGLMAHKNPNMSLEDLFTLLCDQELERLLKPPALARKAMGLIKTYKTVKHNALYECENCHSNYALEVDHIQPISSGGDSNLQNLRLLCRNCNQRAAIEKIGLGQMTKFLEKH